MGYENRSTIWEKGIVGVLEILKPGGMTIIVSECSEGLRYTSIHLFPKKKSPLHLLIK